MINGQHIRIAPADEPSALWIGAQRKRRYDDGDVLCSLFLSGVNAGALC